MTTSPGPDDISYMSAPSSPSGLSVTSMHFYSAPSSPTVSDSQPRTPKTSDVDEFEFETSLRFCVDDDFEFEKIENFEYPLRDLDHQHDQHKRQQLRQRWDSLPAATATMSFADELFCDGQVLPLKPPPRPQTSTASSPRSPSSVIKLPFWHRSLWNDDFDPFMTALENVREEKRGRSQEKNHRRARSLSPLPHCQLFDGSTIYQKPMPQFGTIEPNPLQVGPRPNESAKSKGLVIARRLRASKLGQEKPTKRNRPTVKTSSGVVQENGGSYRRESKRQRIKGFLLRTASIGRDSRGDQSLALWKRFSFKSKEGADSNGKKRVVIEIKTLIKYRPRLFLCLGFGFKARK